MKGVSVIIACYKAGDYLREAVESVHAVAPKLPYEIIVVDDNSRDKATQIALTSLHMTDPAVRVVEQKVNLGQSAARNRAIGMARYDYILPLDSDDRLNPKYPGYLEKSVELLEDNPEVAFTYCKRRFMGTRTGPELMANFNEELFLLRNMIPVCGIFRKGEAIEAGGYREDMRYVEDWELWARLLDERFKHGEHRMVHRFQEPHAFYRIHDTGQNVSVAQKFPLAQVFGEMTVRNGAIYEEHFGTTDPQHLKDLRRKQSSKLRKKFENFCSATPAELAEVLWCKVQDRLPSHRTDGHPKLTVAD